MSQPSQAIETPGENDAQRVACVLVFNANDPSGAGGLAADIATIASVGAHALPVITGAYSRDTAEIVDHFAFDDEAIAEQARTILEDVSAQVFKVGFVGSAEAVSIVSTVAADYAEVPLVAYMPDLSWWNEVQIDLYLDAFRDLLLPQAAVLVGNHSTLSRWLLPDWNSSRNPAPRDIARAASAYGVPYILVTGIPTADHGIDNVLASPQAVLHTERVERLDAGFSGAGDTLAAALAALLASGSELAEAVEEALGYLDRCLGGAFRPGMGQLVPDRLFWAQPDGDDSDEPAEADDGIHFPEPGHDTKH